MRLYVDRINQVLVEAGESNPDLERMGTTWTSLYLMGERAVVVHIGDSRAYLFRQGQLDQITQDQTKGQLLRDAGLEPEIARRFQHVLLNSLGAGNSSCSATIHDFDIEEHDQILLCSDGLSDMVEDALIAKILEQDSTPQEKCAELIQVALENGGKDNITVAIAEAASRHGRHSISSRTSSPANCLT